jgi:hypothetical protein
MPSNRIITAVLLIVVAATASAASDEACTRETLKPLAVPAPTHIDVDALFRADPAAGAAAAPLEGMEVLIARVGPDGKLVLACVDSAEAAKKFLEAPIEKTGRAAKEQ